MYCGCEMGMACKCLDVGVGVYYVDELDHAQMSHVCVSSVVVEWHSLSYVFYRATVQQYNTVLSAVKYGYTVQ